MKIGFEAGEYEGRTHRSRRLLGVVILLLFITGCIGLQVLLYLASSDGENKIWRVGILANSTADYSLDDLIQVAPISPDILEELAREDARLSPTPSEAITPPVIGQISPTQTSGFGGETTPTPFVTIQPTFIPTGSETPVTPTPITPTSVPLLQRHPRRSPGRQQLLLQRLPHTLRSQPPKCLRLRLLRLQFHPHQRQPPGFLPHRQPPQPFHRRQHPQPGYHRHPSLPLRCQPLHQHPSLPLRCQPLHQHLFPPLPE